MHTRQTLQQALNPQCLFVELVPLHRNMCHLILADVTQMIICHYNGCSVCETKRKNLWPRVDVGRPKTVPTCANEDAITATVEKLT